MLKELPQGKKLKLLLQEKTLIQEFTFTKYLTAKILLDPEK
jgi:hypothetical protein